MPVHADDRLLLGMRWREKTYIESALPFGLRSAPKVFNAVADAMQLILEQHAALLGRLPRHRFKRVQTGTIGLCRRLVIPISVHKTEGPSDIRWDDP